MAIATGAALLGAAAIGAGAQIAGAKAASSASKNAAKTQSRAADKAIALNQQVYRDQQQLMSPWLSGGSQAFANMQRMAGGQPQMPQQPLGAAMGAQPPMQGGQPLGQMLGAQPPQMGQPQMGGGMVKVQSPDGEVREFPQNVAQMLVARGGQIVSQ